MTFRPAKGMTLAMLPALLLLLWLGNWQLERRVWKLDLITTAHENLTKPAVPFDQASSSAAPSTWRYEKIRVQGTLHGEKAVYLYATGPEEEPVYRVISPLILPDGRAVLVDRGYVAALGEGMDAGPVTGTFTGYLQPDGRGTLGIRGGNEDLWTYRDVPGMAAALGVTPALANTLVLLPGENEDLSQTPIPLPPHLEFVNNHLSYAVTWFGLAFALVAVYIAFHVREGRFVFAAEPKPEE